MQMTSSIILKRTAVLLALAFLAVPGLTAQTAGQTDPVPVGFGNANPADLSSAVTVVTAQDLDRRSVPSAAQALQGLVPSLWLDFDSGSPSAGYTALLRGLVSTGTAAPLVLVDGVETPLDRVNPNDIARISVLKDAAAAAIYGARAAGGAILVTTKRGTRQPGGKADLSLNLFSGLAGNTTGTDLSALPASLNGSAPEDLLLNPLRLRNDWNVSARGASEAFSYYVGGRYACQKGLLQSTSGASGDEQYNLVANFDARITRWLRYSLHASWNHRDDRLPFWGGADVLFPAWAGVEGAPDAQDCALAVLSDQSTFRQKEHLFTFKNGLEAKLARDWTVGASFAFQRDFDFGQQRSSEIEDTDPETVPNRYIETRTTRRTNSADGYLSWRHRFGENHRVQARVGADYQDGTYKWVITGVDNLIDPSIYAMTAGDGVFDVDEKLGSFAQMGLFGQLSYAGKNRYLLEATLRTDSSSRFAPGQRRAWSPAVSAGWVLSEEPFFAPWKQAVNLLKIRGSWGSIANQQTADWYPWLQYIAKHSAWENRLFSRSGLSSYATFANNVASDLTWETVMTEDVGLDAAFLGNRLTFTGDLFLRDTRDVLTDAATLPGMYGAPTPLMNAAALRTAGFETAVSWHDAVGAGDRPLHYSLAGSYSDTRSSWTQFPSADAPDLEEGLPHGLLSFAGLAEWNHFDISCFLQGVRQLQWQPEDGSVLNGQYLRLKNVAAGYSFPLRPNGFIRRLRIGVTAENLFFVSALKDERPFTDPDLYHGTGAGHPFPRTCLLQLQVNL